MGCGNARAGGGPSTACLGHDILVERITCSGEGRGEVRRQVGAFQNMGSILRAVSTQTA